MTSNCPREAGKVFLVLVVAAKPVEVVELRILCCCKVLLEILFGSQLACSNTFLASSSLSWLFKAGEWRAEGGLPLTSITDWMDAVRDLVRDLLGGAMGSSWVVSAESSGSSGRSCPGRRPLGRPPPRGTGRGSRSCGG